ncbi:MAG TPA: helix-turn-helix transcriptional regulator [Candidatus Aquicultor sp.]|jgi:transcriptional regulator with XRE-family HTH domain
MITQLKLQLVLKDIKQADIARAAGVHRAYINRVVLGRQKPSERVIKAFKEVAGIEVGGK